ncbi:MAG: dNTP triphosphohydrolase [Rickettsiales bacterium]|nr:dNTP triphosphohydrolase [Rickettsiales bacterium]
MENNLTAFKLTQYAINPNKSKGRLYKFEMLNPFIDNFKEDILRIVRASSFRRLAYKTQVFVNDHNKIDHYRSRLTHSVEVSVIGKIISEALCLSSSLTEAICLAHDIGHPPFGHRGEEVLDDILKPYGGFNHNYHAFKLVTQVEEKYLDQDGLNLTWEVLEGLVKHNGPLLGKYAKVKNIPSFILEYNKIHDLWLNKFPSLEAQVASISDDISYVSHDLEDGLNEGLFSLQDILKEEFISSINEHGKLTIGKFDSKRIIYELMSSITSFFVEDVINSSKKKIKALQIKTFQDITNYDSFIISFSEEGQKILNQIKSFLNKNMYKNAKVVSICESYKHLIQDIYKICINNPKLLPIQWRNKKLPLQILVGDYIAGMTDRFIIKTHKQLTSTTRK